MPNSLTPDNPSLTNEQREISTPQELFDKHPELVDYFEQVFSKYEVNPENGMLKSFGHEYTNTPRMKKLIRRANRIRRSLPPIPEHHIRLWRGNRPGEIGGNPSFTSSLEGIALPFLRGYGGKLSYVDMSENMYNQTVQTGLVAKDCEFILTRELASVAQEIDEEKIQPIPEAIALAQQYINENSDFNTEIIVNWLNKILSERESVSVPL